MQGMLNPAVDRSSIELTADIVSASYVVLALGLGKGFNVLEARVLNRAHFSKA